MSTTAVALANFEKRMFESTNGSSWNEVKSAGNIDVNDANETTDNSIRGSGTNAMAVGIANIVLNFSLRLAPGDTQLQNIMAAKATRAARWLAVTFDNQAPAASNAWYGGLAYIAESNVTTEGGHQIINCVAHPAPATNVADQFQGRGIFANAAATTTTTTTTTTGE
jgi:hypothetical protein